LVLGNIPSLREVWGDSAIYVPPEDADALREALSRLIADETWMKQCAQAAASCARMYTPGAIAVGYMDLYQQRLRRHGRGAAGKTASAAATPGRRVVTTVQERQVV